MKSIRLYLLLSLIATITLVNFIALLHGYNSSMEQAQQLFDERLQSVAKVIASANAEEDKNSPHSNLSTPHFFFQIWSNDGRLINRSSNAPANALSVFATGFHDVNYKHYRWRNFIFYDDQLKRWIVTAERSDIRYTLAEQVVLESIVPIILAIPVSALIIWWLVGLGLRPLYSLAEQLKLKQADDLSPILLENMPSELIQLTQSTNALFERLDNAFQREQRFSADAAHELRTPISVLKVHLHNLQIKLGDRNEALNFLSQGVERMGHLVEQILALYRTSPDQAMTNFKEIDLHTLVQNSIANHYGQFEAKQQTIELTGVVSEVNGDQFALETLIQNLLSNASKYTPIGGQIRVNTEQLQNNIRLTIEDSGQGIPEDQYNRVFERFYRLTDTPRSLETVSCGLGLAIVKHIVELHHATIKLAPSDFGSGLKVTIDFPAGRAH